MFYDCKNTKISKHAKISLSFCRICKKTGLAVILKKLPRLIFAYSKKTTIFAP